jgi:Flp pilus assembly pilin Flp
LKKSKEKNMLRFLKSKRGQNTAEYAILIAIVVGGIVAMQTYLQRAFKGRMRDASLTLVSQTNELGNTQQYEEYYSNTVSYMDKEDSKTQTGKSTEQFVNTSKGAGSVERVEYNGEKGW